MKTLTELHARLEREQAYFAKKGSKLDFVLWPPVEREVVHELARQLAVELPPSYVDFLMITNGLWLELKIPSSRANDERPLVDSAGIDPCGYVVRASAAVRDLADCVDFKRASQLVCIGADGMIGDFITLYLDENPPSVLACTHDRPRLLMEPEFRIAESFEEFLDRFLGASLEGRESITYWMD